MIQINLVEEISKLRDSAYQMRCRILNRQQVQSGSINELKTATISNQKTIVACEKNMQMNCNNLLTNCQIFENQIMQISQNTTGCEKDLPVHHHRVC